MGLGAMPQKGTGTGIGLGLARCFGLVRAHVCARARPATVLALGERRGAMGERKVMVLRELAEEEEVKVFLPG